MGRIAEFLFGRLPEPDASAIWLREAERSMNTLSLRQGERVLGKILVRKVREIHRRFERFYAPYGNRSSWLGGKRKREAPPDTLLLPTRWLLKKHAAVAAEFRALETSLARIAWDEVAPTHVLETGLLLDGYVEETAFRFSEETLASTLNDWQESRQTELSLAETEAASPLLRLLALDKLSAVSMRLSETEAARREAHNAFARSGPSREQFQKSMRRFLKKRGERFARAFSEAFEEALSKEAGPFSRFRTGGTIPPAPVRLPESASAQLATRVRILLRSLSLLGEFEWMLLLKKTNTLHRLLVRDPADVYSRMTSLSQETYRKKAAAIAKILRLPEASLAKAALELAEQETESPKNHIGFYLLDDGLPALLTRISGSPRLSWWYWYHDRTKLTVIRRIYLGGIALLSISLSLAFMAIFLRYRMLIIIIFPVIYKSVKHLADSLFVGIVPATFLPRIKVGKRIPDSSGAVFVIPALLKNTDTLRALMGKLETAYLSNRSGAITFCLLLDFPDAHQETLPEDDLLRNETRAAFHTLNARYGETDRFWFVLRHRMFSPRQDRWMGWERKRGKLLDFARLLRNEASSSPFLMSRASVPRADFVITMDEDAFIPRDFIRDMIGIHDHPLHRPVLSNGKRVRGYTFIQPNVKQWFRNRHRFRLPRIYFDEKRFSAYSSVSPEIYQDVFLEGSYAGKGSFHVDAFLAALDKTLPQDQVLSHDLLEGSLARSAYAADIDVFDEFPKSLRAMLARSHRWTRGDWQIIDWLFGRFRDESGSIRPNPLAPIHRFKIADNLLMSLFRPSVFFVTILSWLVQNTPLLFFVWGLFLAELFLIDAVIDWTRWFGELFSGKWRHLSYRFRKTSVRSARLARQMLFEIAILPASSLDTVHAILTALWRRYGSGKHMLEWVPSAHFENTAGKTPLIFPLLILAAVGGSIRLDLPIHPFFGSLLALWMGTPLLFFILNRPYGRRDLLPEAARMELRRDALATWSFFESVVDRGTNFLPPDYRRFDPSPSVAQYTSITNIGFYLTSVLVALRLGFLSRRRALERLEKTICTLETLETYRGHFYNWYDVHAARPAPPPFISSVDSGNLLAALITTRQWLSKTRSAARHTETGSGLSDMVRFVQERLPNEPEFLSFRTTWEAITKKIERLPSGASGGAPHKERLALADSFDALSFPDSLPEEVRIAASLLKDRVLDLSSEETSESSELDTIALLKRRLDALIAAMRFDFLRSGKRGLISIGFHVPSKRLENRFYQTLASEARITSFLALAEGTLSFRGWNKLNRSVLALPPGPALISWTGTLFEYLMPAIFLEEHGDSLVGTSIKTAIRMNRRFARRLRIPLWGLSESGYAELDRGGSYRYKPFGLPALSLSPSPDDRPVVSAYVSAMSLSFFPDAARKNLALYRRYGGSSPFGYLESIDFHRSKHGSPVRMCMSHHQGMILAAIGNVLFERFLSRLFESHPLVQNSLFVLDEGIPPIDREPFPKPALPYLHTPLVHPRTP